MQTAWASIVPASHCWTFIIRILPAENISQSWRDGGDLVPSECIDTYTYIYSFIDFQFGKKKSLTHCFLYIGFFFQIQIKYKKKDRGTKKVNSWKFYNIMQKNRASEKQWNIFFSSYFCILNQLSLLNRLCVISHNQIWKFPKGFKMCFVAKKVSFFYLLLALNSRPLPVEHVDVCQALHNIPLTTNQWPLQTYWSGD